jgi:hypothetical protein
MLDAMDAVLALSLAAFAVALFGISAKVKGFPAYPVIAGFFFLLVAGTVVNVFLDSLFESPDADYYLAWGQDLAKLWSGETVANEVQTSWPSKIFWASVLGFLSLFVETPVLSAIVVNSFLCASCIVLLGKVVEGFTTRRAYWGVAFLLCSNPSFVLFGPSLLREGLYWFSLSLSLFAIATLEKGRVGRGRMLLILGCSLQVAVRPDLGAISGALILTVFLLTFSLSARFSSLLETGLRAFGLGFLWVTTLSWVYLTQSLTETYFSRIGSRLSGVRGGSESGFDSSFSTAEFASEGPCQSSSLANYVCNGLGNLPQVLFALDAWPNLANSGASLLYVLGLGHFFLLVGFAVYALKLGEIPKPAGVLIFSSSLFLIFVFSSMLTNFGLLARFLVSAGILLMPLALAGFLHAWTTVKERRETVKGS